MLIVTSDHLSGYHHCGKDDLALCLSKSSLIAMESLFLTAYIMTVFQVILALLLPPIAVATRYGLRSAFVISVLLTVLGRVPGVIHAFVMLTRAPDKPVVKKKA